MEATHHVRTPIVTLEPTENNGIMPLLPIVQPESKFESN